MDSGGDVSNDVWKFVPPGIELTVRRRPLSE